MLQSTKLRHSGAFFAVGFFINLDNKGFVKHTYTGVWEDCFYSLLFLYCVYFSITMTVHFITDFSYILFLFHNSVLPIKSTANYTDYSKPNIIQEYFYRIQIKSDANCSSDLKLYSCIFTVTLSFNHLIDGRSAQLRFQVLNLFISHLAVTCRSDLAAGLMESRLGAMPVNTCTFTHR